MFAFDIFEGLYVCNSSFVILYHAIYWQVSNMVGVHVLELYYICTWNSDSVMFSSSLALQNISTVGWLTSRIQFLFTLEFCCSQITSSIRDVNSSSSELFLTSCPWSGIWVSLWSFGRDCELCLFSWHLNHVIVVRGCLVFFVLLSCLNQGGKIQCHQILRIVLWKMFLWLGGFQGLQSTFQIKVCLRSTWNILPGSNRWSLSLHDLCFLLISLSQDSFLSMWHQSVMDIQAQTR